MYSGRTAEIQYDTRMETRHRHDVRQRRHICRYAAVTLGVVKEIYSELFKYWTVPYRIVSYILYGTVLELLILVDKYDARPSSIVFVRTEGFYICLLPLNYYIYIRVATWYEYEYTHCTVRYCSPGRFIEVKLRSTAGIRHSSVLYNALSVWLLFLGVF